MTDAALENAMARRSDMLNRLTTIANEINALIDVHGSLRGDLEEVEGFIKMWHTMAGTQPPPKMEQNVSVEGAEGGRRIRPKNPPREDVAAACVSYILDADRPLGRAELLEHLTEDGIIIRGKDPAMVLSTMLWRSKDVIRRLPKGGYWLAQVPLPSEQGDDFGDLLAD